MSEWTHAAVAVANAPETQAQLADQLADALGDLGLTFSPARRLADGEALSAQERLFSAPIGQDWTALRGIGAVLSNADVGLTPVAERRKKLLVCDMDSTIIGQECLDELADFAGLKAEVAAITERAMRGELDFEGALKTRVAMLQGLETEAINRCYAERISLNPGATELVATMRANGARCLLVSGGFTAFTGPVAAAAGFDEHHSNTLIIDGNNRLTGEVAEPVLGREAKLERLLKTAKGLGLSAPDALAIGDGANDLAMIEAAGLGLAYRAKPVVAQAADAAIQQTDLRTALFFQGYSGDEIRTSPQDRLT